MTVLQVEDDPMGELLEQIADQADVLASLRTGVGRSLDEAPSSWPYVVRVSQGKRWREAPAHVTITLFALHHQGKEPGSLNEPGRGLGRSALELRTVREAAGGSAEGVERRMRALMGADELDALAVHLRGLVQLMRAADVSLDYVRLYKDLCSWMRPEWRSRVCYRWAREYFQIEKQEKK